MPTYFLDTSALVKRHVAEPGHAWAEALCDEQSGNTIAIAEVSIVEVTATLERVWQCRIGRHEVEVQSIVLSPLATHHVPDAY